MQQEFYQQTKPCQNKRKSKYCIGDFDITPDDFTFYEKINVPPPSFCPECRLQRRLVWMKGIDLFYRKCDLCQEMKLSMYHPDAPYVVYCDRCWWSDNWDARGYGQSYDSTRPFFEQWNELFHKTPILGLSIDKTTGELSSFCNHVGHSKNCSLVFYADYNEECMNCYMLTRAKNTLDSANCMDAENIYDCSHVYKTYNLVGSFGNNRFCYDSYFTRDCEGVNNCFGSISENKTEYMFLGQKMTKDGWQEKIKEIDLGSYTNYQYWKKLAFEYFKTVSPKPNWDSLSVNCTGSYVFHSKNAKDCLDVIDCEDSRYLMMIKNGKVKDCYDYTDWGMNCERLYECMTVGEGATDVYFCHESGHSILDVQYSKLSIGGSHHFGCVSMKKQEYCILNKQYSKEDYEKLKMQIVEEMNNNPYISLEGQQYRYGEFFPPEFSPHAYNDTFAHRFFPLSEEETIEKGLGWYVVEPKEYTITMNTDELPDHIQKVGDTILSEVIQCPNCPRGYKVMQKELDFLRQRHLPLPRMCPFCRVWQKIDMWVDNMKLVHRNCALCNVEFKTHIKKDKYPVVYCPACWKKEYR
jgi:hypothetical protein